MPANGRWDLIRRLKVKVLTQNSPKGTSQASQCPSQNSKCAPSEHKPEALLLETNWSIKWLLLPVRSTCRWSRLSTCHEDTQRSGSTALVTLNLSREVHIFSQKNTACSQSSLVYWLDYGLDDLMFDAQLGQEISISKTSLLWDPSWLPFVYRGSLPGGKRATFPARHF